MHPFFKENDLTAIGSKIKTLRKERKITQKNLALVSGISNTYLSDIEIGRTNPSLRTLEKIADALGISIKDLFE